MQIMIVPTKYGYAAVGLRSSLMEKRERAAIRSPKELPADVLAQIRGTMWAQLAEYLHEVGYWGNWLGLAAGIWAGFGLLALFCTKLWGYGIEMVALYGWVRVWFLAAGVWLLTRWLAKWRHRVRAKRIRAWVTEPMERGGAPPITRIELPDSNVYEYVNPQEKQYIEMYHDLYPDLRPYYDQMLEVDPPAVFDRQATGVLSSLRNLVLGPPIRLPRLVVYVGEL